MPRWVSAARIHGVPGHFKNTNSPPGGPTNSNSASAPNNRETTMAHPSASDWLKAGGSWKPEGRNGWPIAALAQAGGLAKGFPTTAMMHKVIRTSNIADGTRRSPVARLDGCAESCCGFQNSFPLPFSDRARGGGSTSGCRDGYAGGCLRTRRCPADRDQESARKPARHR